MRRNSDLHSLRDRYHTAVLSGEKDVARSVVEDALGRGIGAPSVYLDLLWPTQVAIGELWHEGKINVAQEHLATSIAIAMMDLMLERMPARQELGFRAVVAPVEGDDHFIGARMVADFLLFDGWQVIFLAGSAPAADLAVFAKQKQADLVALSSTVPQSLPNAKLAAEALSKLDPTPKLLLGGCALEGIDLDVSAIGCDAIGRNASEALSEARRLVGLGNQSFTLEDHLTAMGRRINSIRTSRHMTQQELANASGLDRTYISMVERGKQNLTIGAVLRIADALGVPIGHLIGPDTV